MKGLFLGLMLLSISFNTYALRCGQNLIRVGDPVHLLLQYCDNYVTNIGATKIYLIQNGLTYKIRAIDGQVKEIRWERR